ncbi:MAG: Smr/MutS family protein [Bacteriovoracaceae bacterium]|nr:Smr/MutS family protein [Bacteriovoracaceae bacterium]
MKTYDLHGKTLEEALIFVEYIIGQIRLSGKSQTIKVITGRGIIREKLTGYLESQNIQWEFEWGNDATFIIEID